MTIKRLLWIASTPIALTLLLSAPVGAVSDEPVEGAEEETGEHHVLTNPIQNFASHMFDYKGKDDHGGPYEPEKGDHKMPAPFSMALLNFAALIFIVGKFFAPGIAKMTRERHEEIAKNLAESAKLREEAQRKLDEYKGRLDGLDKEIAQVTASIRAEAEAEKGRILAEATSRVERMQRDAEQQIAADMQRVRVELEREAVLQAVAAAQKILQEKTGDADQRALVDGFIKQLGTTARGRA
jgi:F-type H+-transporting ATPase subunit b